MGADQIVEHLCVLPWYAKDIKHTSDAITACCLHDNKSVLSEIKSEFIKGNKPKQCASCWTSEENNHTSKRQFENRNLAYLLEVDISELQRRIVSEPTETLMYQISTSNLCNSACVMCDSRASTTWAKYERKMGIKPSPLQKIDKINTHINFKTAKSIIFAGGEPMFDPDVFLILEQLLINNNTTCFVSVVTNGVTKLKDSHAQLIKQFENFNFCFSIDGTEKLFEYVRYPGKWPVLLENLNFYRTLTSNISVNYTMNNLNKHEHEKTIKWFNDNKLPYAVNEVSHPAFMAPGVGVTHELWPTFISNIKKQDIAKNIDIKNYIPYISNLINNSLIQE